MITVELLSKDEWLVTVKARTTTKHRVRVTPDEIRRLGGEDVPAERLLEASFRFLLERESNTSILSSFNLPVIGRYFPEYEKEIGRYLRFAAEVSHSPKEPAGPDQSVQHLQPSHLKRLDMALIDCPDCGKQISDSAPSCLGCGRPMKSIPVFVQPPSPSPAKSVPLCPLCHNPLGSKYATVCRCGASLRYSPAHAPFSFVLGVAFLVGAIIGHLEAPDADSLNILFLLPIGLAGAFSFIRYGATLIAGKRWCRYHR